MQADFQHIVFLGIGGIGMSALARYFRAQGLSISGYDRTETVLTHELTHEGMTIVYDYEELIALCKLREPLDTAVVRTAAIHDTDPVYRYFVENGFRVMKRAELLGEVTRSKNALCVAGTHGKTTTTTMLAHIMHMSHLGGSAFLGGISNNYHTNLLIDDSDYVAVEADEYDRSFLHLRPYMSVITSIDPDHLDIYGDATGYQQGFDDYASLVEKAIIVKEGYSVHFRAGSEASKHCKIFTYAVESDTADFTAANTLQDIRLQVPTRTNIEDAVAAAAIARLNGVTHAEIKAALESFNGVERRFEVKLKTDNLVLIDDYAHHPTELQGSIDNVHELFPHSRLIAVFQPHLYSRTRDFMDGFAEVLSQADELLLLPIYPAREEPIEGVTSEALSRLAAERNPKCHARVVEKKDLIGEIITTLGGAAGGSSVKATPQSSGCTDAGYAATVVLMVGAGNISDLVEPVKTALVSKIAKTE